jgi:CMP-N-acetylneuraminic acid synthetase
MKNVDFDILITIQATSPFTTSDDLDKAIEQFIEENNDSMLT